MLLSLVHYYSQTCTFLKIKSVLAFTEKKRLPESRESLLWGQETSGFPAVLSSHRWTLFQPPCTLRSTESSSLRSENTCWGYHFAAPRNFQLLPLLQSGCPRLPQESVQCQHILNIFTDKQIEQYHHVWGCSNRNKKYAVLVLMV